MTLRKNFHLSEVMNTVTGQGKMLWQLFLRQVWKARQTKSGERKAQEYANSVFLQEGRSGRRRQEPLPWSKPSHTMGNDRLSPQACRPLCVSYFLDESRGIIPPKHTKNDFFFKFHQRNQIKMDTERGSRGVKAKGKSNQQIPKEDETHTDTHTYLPSKQT